MPKRLRKSDGAALAGGLLAAAQTIPTEAISASAEYQAVATAVPSSIVWSLVGFSLALWLFFPWEEEPRWQQFWRWLNGEFRVEKLASVVRIEEDREWAAVSASLRMGRRIKRAQLTLRVYSCVGRTIPEEVIVLRELSDVPSGARIPLSVARFLIPQKGVSAASAGTWGDRGEGPNLIRESDNLAVLELPGRFVMQRYRLHVAHRSPKGDAYSPVLFAVGEDQGIFEEP